MTFAKLINISLEASLLATGPTPFQYNPVMFVESCKVHCKNGGSKTEICITKLLVRTVHQDFHTSYYTI